jgi:hypothetical protein
LNIEELHNLYTKVIKSRKFRWVRACSTTGEIRITYKILTGEQQEKIPLGRSNRRWDDNIKICLKETICKDANWIKLIQKMV